MWSPTKKLTISSTYNRNTLLGLRHLSQCSQPTYGLLFKFVTESCYKKKNFKVSLKQDLRHYYQSNDSFSTAQSLLTLIKLHVAATNDYDSSTFKMQDESCETIQIPSLGSRQLKLYHTFLSIIICMKPNRLFCLHQNFMICSNNFTS